MFFDISHNNKFMDQHCEPSQQRTKNIKFKYVHARLNVYAHSLFPFTARLWNAISCQPVWKMRKMKICLNLV